MASIEDLRAELKDIGPDAWREKYWRFAQHEVKTILAELEQSEVRVAEQKQSAGISRRNWGAGALVFVTALTLALRLLGETPLVLERMAAAYRAVGPAFPVAG